MKRCLFNRIMSFTLALLMVFSQLSMPVLSLSRADLEKVAAAVGKTVVFAWYYEDFILSANPAAVDDYDAALWDDTVEYSVWDYVDSKGTRSDHEVDEFYEAFYAMRMVIVESYVAPAEHGAVWYRVEAAPGYALPSILQSNPWIFAYYCGYAGGEDDCSLEVVNPGTSNGVTVDGLLPIDATLEVDIPELDLGDGTQIFDISVQRADGSKWQPMVGETVRVSLPVSTDAETMTVMHFMESVDHIRDMLDSVEIVDVSDAEDAVKDLLSGAIAAYYEATGEENKVAVEIFENVPVENGAVSVDSSGFSIYIYFDGGNRDAYDDWESYFGYADIEAARTAIREQSAIVYKIRVGSAYKLKMLFNKGLTQTVGKWYTVTMEQNQNGVFSAMTASNYMTGPTGEDREGFLIYNYKNVSFTGTNVTPDDSYIFITYKNANGDIEAANKTIIVQIVPENIPIEPVPDDIPPLYIGVDPNVDNVFPSEPTTDVSGFYWYENGSMNKTLGNPVWYTEKGTSTFFAINAFNQSALKQPGDGVYAIIDHSGIRTMNFVNMGSTFKDEIIQKMGGGLSMTTHTVLVYAVKMITSGNYPGYYIMCKVVPKGAMTVSYEANLPNGVEKTFANWPEVDIVAANAAHTISYEPSSFDVQEGNLTYTYEFVGWSTNQGAHPDDAPGKNLSTDDDEWYYSGSTITNTAALQGTNVILYAIWKSNKTYADATVEFHYNKYDENGDPVTGSAIPAVFTVDQKFVDASCSYRIYNATGGLAGSGNFADGNTFELQHGYYIVIDAVPNADEPYTISCAPIEGYAANEGLVTEIWLTEAENKQGYERRNYDVYKQQYTLTWDVDGQKTQVQYYYGDTIQTLASPTKTGYNFAGWSSAVPQTMPGNDLTLAATWTPIGYTIKFNLNGGSGSVSNVSYTIEGSVTLPTTGFQRTGYAFNGWKPSSTVGNWNSGTVYYGTMSGMYGNVTLTAQWVQKDYTITYDYAGGALSSGITNIGGYKTNEKITLNNPVRAGYTFTGWEITSGGTDWTKSKYAPGEQITTGTGNVTITAQWERDTYNITYNLDGGMAGGSYPNQYNVETGDIQIADPTRLGYEFLGWTGTGLTSPTKNLVIPKGSTGNRDYTANWSAKEYIISLDLGDGRRPETYTALYGSLFTLPTPSRDGYTFGVWKVTKTDGEWELGDEYTSNLTVLSGNVTLTAQWKSLQHTITLKDGDEVLKTITQDYGSTVATPAAPTKTGYSFAGWYEDDDLTKAYTFTTMPDDDITVYAKWTVNQYTITWKDGDEVLKTITQDYGSAVVAPANPTKYGYVFEGWNRQIPSTMPAENITITAVWEIARTTMTISIGNGATGTFIFRVTGTDVNVTVTVEAGKPVTITGLQVGEEYTITDLRWNWKYQKIERSIVATETPMSVVLNPTSNQSGWLGGESN